MFSKNHVSIVTCRFVVAYHFKSLWNTLNFTFTRNWAIPTVQIKLHLGANLLGVLDAIPDLVADFLLILLVLASAAETVEDDGEKEEDQENGYDGSCDDTSSVACWDTQEEEF